MPAAGPGEVSKECRDCGEVKPLDEFGLFARSSDGHNYYCRPCHGQRRLKSSRQHANRSATYLAALYAAQEKTGEEKECPACQTFIPLANFAKNRRRPDGRQGYCRECMKDYEARRSSRGRYLWSTYRLRMSEYRNLLAAQGGRCAACSTNEPGGKGVFVVDHDHTCCPTTPTCGQCTRGLLCHACNVSAGMVGDDPRRMLALASYLEGSAHAA